MIQFVTPAGLARAAILLTALSALALWGWTVMIRMPGKSMRGPLPPLTEEERRLRDGLRSDVAYLAGVIGERNMERSTQLTAAAAFIERALSEAGYEVGRQGYRVDGLLVDNLIAERRGAQRPDELLIVGAHYDSVSGSPGANDNASGVAALLALARGFAATPRPRTIRFVAFVNEEPPYFQTERMGSLVYARACRARAEQIVGMLSLETIGYYSDEPGSQHYPFPFGLWYPTRGNFIGVVGNLASRGFVRRIVGLLREHARHPSEGVAAPAAVPGIAWSDQWAFWEQGYPAVMVTDTAPYRDPDYHLASDTPERLDYERLARVVAGLNAVIANLAGSKLNL